MSTSDHQANYRRLYRIGLRGVPQATATSPPGSIDRRSEAFARFQAFAWPSSRDEEWRRTDIRGFKLDGFGPPGHRAALTRDSGRARPRSGRR